MDWLLLSLASGFCVAVKNVLARKLVFMTDRQVILYSKYVFVSLFAIAIIFITGIPEIKPGFYFYIITASAIDIVAAWCLLSAIALSQLAKTFPLVAFTPIFLLATSFFVLGEVPSALGLAGILLIVSGAYLLRAESLKTGIFEPIKLLLKEKGSRHMLMAAFLFSFMAAFFKKAVLNSSPLFAFSVTQLLSTLFLTVFFVKKKTLGSLFKKTADNFKLLFVSSVIGFLAGLCLFKAFEFGLASYVISVKRTSILFTIILGYIFFKEDNLIKSLIIGSVMIVGIFLVSLG